MLIIIKIWFGLDHRNQISCVISLRVDRAWVLSILYEELKTSFFLFFYTMKKEKIYMLVLKNMDIDHHEYIVQSQTLCNRGFLVLI